MVQSLFNEAVSAPIAIDKIIPSKLLDRELDNQSKPVVLEVGQSHAPQIVSSLEDHQGKEEDETTLTKTSQR